jgi:hypothetical protein
MCNCAHHITLYCHYLILPLLHVGVQFSARWLLQEAGDGSNRVAHMDEQFTNQTKILITWFLKYLHVFNDGFSEDQANLIKQLFVD